MDACLQNNMQQWLDSPDAALVDAAQMGNSFAMEQLLYSYRDVVRGKVRRYFVRGAEQEDLLQIGMIGLWQAVTDYSPSRSISFVAFAKICVERHIISAIKGSCRKKQCFLNEALSLDQHLGVSDPDITLGEVLAGPKELDPENQLIQKETMNLLGCCLQSMLSDFEWEVLKLYNNGKSYCDIADILDCKAKSVDNALGRVRRKLEDSPLAKSEVL